MNPQTKYILDDVTTDVGLCLTVTCLYTFVGLGLVAAFM